MKKTNKNLYFSLQNKIAFSKLISAKHNKEPQDEGTSQFHQRNKDKVPFIERSSCKTGLYVSRK